jgi:DNA-binding NtrC family response regulator
MDRPLALVVDSDSAVHSLVREVLEEKDLTTVGVHTAAEAMDVLRTRPLRLLVADLDAPGVTAGDLIGTTRSLRPTAAIAVITGRGDEDAALSALRAGAVDVFAKPLDEPDLRVALERTVAVAELLEECHRLRERLREESGYERIVGRSAVMERLRERLHRIATSQDNVLLQGEDGVGKELVARTLHSLAGDGASFVAIDCAAASAPAVASELEAALAAPGAAERIVFLDSVLDLPHALQDRIAEAIASGARIGSNGLPRLLVSTTGDAERAAEDGRFREDLLRHMAVVALHIPPLRERREDIPLLARHFIDSIREINDLPPIQLSGDALEALERYGWPGNVRELRNVIEQAVILAADGIVRTRNLPERVREGQPTGDEEDPPTLRAFKEAKRQVVETFERRYLRDVLERHSGNVTAAAQHAGMLRSALQRLLRKHNIRSADFRRGRGQTDREL